MDHVVLGNRTGDQPVGYSYVVTFHGRWKVLLKLFPYLLVLLVCRIWHVDRKATRLRAGRQSQLRPILQILVDAGAIYTLTLLVALICFVCQTNGQYVVLDMVSPSCFAP
jgi:hypothetical protein